MKLHVTATFAILALGAVSLASGPAFLWEITREHKIGHGFTPSTSLLGTTGTAATHSLPYSWSALDVLAGATRFRSVDSRLIALQSAGPNPTTSLFAEVQMSDGYAGSVYTGSHRFEFWATLYVRKDIYDTKRVVARVAWDVNGTASNANDSGALGASAGDNGFLNATHTMNHATPLSVSASWINDNMLQGWGQNFDLKTGFTWSVVNISGTDYYKLTNLVTANGLLTAGDGRLGNTSATRATSLQAKILVGTQ
jgi:hypothetical protein